MKKCNRDGNMRKCPKCKVIKPLTIGFWHINHSTYDGFSTMCKICRNENSKKLRVINKEKISEYNKQYSETHQLKRHRDREVDAKRCREYYAKNKEKIKARASKRLAIIKRVIPAWARLDLISKYYEMAGLYTEIYEEEYHVDHIIPIRGKNVYGLHVENNLQILSAFENRCKGNKIGIPTRRLDD
jgi:hypothetical protein